MYTTNPIFSKFIIISTVVHIFVCVFFSLSADPQKIYENNQIRIRIVKKDEQKPNIEKNITKPADVKKNLSEKHDVSNENKEKIEKPNFQNEQRPAKIISDVPTKLEYPFVESKNLQQDDKPSIKIEDNPVYDLQDEESDPEIKMWLTGVRLKISTVASYPESARKKRMEGSTTLLVTVGREGHIKSIEVKKKSGHKILDDSAINKIKKAVPFPPFPKKINSSYVSFIITIVYKAS